MSTNKPIRLAIIGGGRGGAYLKSIDALPEKVELALLCDPNPDVCARWKNDRPDLQTVADFQEVLDDDSIDAIILATPLFLHAEQACAAMEAGKHVLSEVSSAHTTEGCWQLIETQEKTGAKYMLAENFCYFRMNLMVKNMADQNAFGELTHAECGYIHDVRGATQRDGKLLWRGELLRDYNGVNYPTHSLGPVSQWLKINRGDSFDSIVTIASKPASQADYFRQLFGDEHPGSKQEFWKQGDSVLSLIRTKGGVVIYLRNDFSSPRPWNYLHYGLQGTKGVFASGRDIYEEPVVWLSSGETQTSAARFQPLWDFADEYEHPAWIKDGAKAEEAGSLCAFFVLQEFADSILEDRAPAIDVYDSIAISSVFPLSCQSIEENGAPVQFPNFTKNKPQN
jgi:hypothetical protein